MATSNPDRELDRLLDEALSLTPTEREAFVARSCGADDGLRERLKHLLALAVRADGFLDRSQREGVEPAGGAAAPEPADRYVGAYRLVRKLGVGGMGEVWLAERIAGGFRQRVAIKLMHVDAGATRARFDAEREILAGLEHPSIARLYDGGVSDDGQPYMVMEYVEGENLLDWCRRRRAGLQQRLALFLQVCDAVSYAHMQLIVHRDLKPANVLVNDAGEVKLLDFGIAKMLRPDTVVDATHTAHLSPAYAAPEQLTGGRIGTATDVHALGVTLYQLLTDRLPWALESLPLGVAVQRLLVAAPAPASAAASEHGPVPARTLRGDLDAIIGKTLRSEPESRYPDARAMANEIRRHLRHEPINARSGARTYVARRFLRRHWMPLSGALLILFAIGATAIYAEIARRRTETALLRADAVRHFVVGLFADSDPEARDGQSLSVRELVDIGAQRVQAGLGNDPDTRIELLDVIGSLYYSLGEYARATQMHRQQLELADTLYRADDPRLVNAQLNVALAEEGAERFDEARALLNRALTTVSSRDAALRARVLHRLGMLEYQGGRYADAGRHVDQAISLLRSASDATPTALAQALSDQGLIMLTAGQIAESEAPLRAALALAQEADPESIIEIRDSLSKTLQSLGKFDEARALAQSNIATSERIYGAGHLRTADHRYQLATISRMSGDMESAVQAYEAALAIYREALGPEHSYVATTLNSLAGALSGLGRDAESLAALFQAREIYLKTLGPAHLHTTTNTTTLGNVLLRSGDLDGAEREFRAALEAYSQIGDGRHPFAEAARMGLAEVLRTRGRCSEAEPLARQARNRLAHEFGAGDFRVLQAQGTLVHCLAASRRSDEAWTLIAESERALASATGEMERERGQLARMRHALGEVDATQKLDGSRRE